jgi:hypothetical protein
VRNVPLPLLWTGPAIYHAASRASTENMAFLPEQGSLNLPRVGAVRSGASPDHGGDATGLGITWNTVILCHHPKFHILWPGGGRWRGLSGSRTGAATHFLSTADGTPPPPPSGGSGSAGRCGEGTGNDPPLAFARAVTSTEPVMALGPGV